MAIKFLNSSFTSTNNGSEIVHLNGVTHEDYLLEFQCPTQFLKLRVEGAKPNHWFLKAQTLTIRMMQGKNLEVDNGTRTFEDKILDKIFFTDFEGNPYPIDNEEDEKFEQEKYLQEFDQDLKKFKEDFEEFKKGKFISRNQRYSRSVIFVLNLFLIVGAALSLLYLNEESLPDIFSVVVTGLITIATIVPAAVVLLLDKKSLRLSNYAPVRKELEFNGPCFLVFWILSFAFSIMIHETQLKKDFSILSIFLLVELILIASNIFDHLVRNLDPKISTFKAIEPHISNIKQKSKIECKDTIRELTDIAFVEQQANEKQAVRWRMIGLAALVKFPAGEKAISEDSFDAIQALGYLGQRFIEDRELAQDAIMSLLVTDSEKSQSNDEKIADQEVNEIWTIINSCLYQNRSRRISLFGTRAIQIKSRNASYSNRGKWLNDLFDLGIRKQNEHLSYVLPLLITIAFEQPDEKLVQELCSRIIQLLDNLKVEELEDQFLRWKFKGENKHPDKHPVRYLVELWRKIGDEDPINPQIASVWRKFLTQVEEPKFSEKDLEESYFRWFRNLDEEEIKKLISFHEIKTKELINRNYLEKIYTIFFKFENFLHFEKRNIDLSKVLLNSLIPDNKKVDNPTNFQRYLWPQYSRNQNLQESAVTDFVKLIHDTAGQHQKTNTDKNRPHPLPLPEEIEYFFFLSRLWLGIIEGINENSIKYDEIKYFEYALEIKFDVFNNLRKIWRKIDFLGNVHQENITKEMEKLKVQLANLLFENDKNNRFGSQLDILMSLDLLRPRSNNKDFQKKYLYLIAGLDNFFSKLREQQQNKFSGEISSRLYNLILEYLEKRLESCYAPYDFEQESFKNIPGEWRVLNQLIIELLELDPLQRTIQIRDNDEDIFLQARKYLDQKEFEIKFSLTGGREARNLGNLIDSVSAFIQFRLGVAEENLVDSKASMFKDFKIWLKPSKNNVLLLDFLVNNLIEKLENKDKEKFQVLRESRYPFLTRRPKRYAVYFVPSKESPLTYFQHVFHLPDLLGQRESKKTFICTERIGTLRWDEDYIGDCQFCVYKNNPVLTNLHFILFGNLLNNNLDSKVDWQGATFLNEYNYIDGMETQINNILVEIGSDPTGIKGQAVEMEYREPDYVTFSYPAPRFSRVLEQPRKPQEFEIYFKKEKRNVKKFLERKILDQKSLSEIAPLIILMNTID